MISEEECLIPEGFMNSIPLQKIHFFLKNKSHNDKILIYMLNKATQVVQMIQHIYTYIIFCIFTEVFLQPSKV